VQTAYSDKPNGILISEILADTDGESAFDRNGEGKANKADDYVRVSERV
jgi:hypothetical protein